MMIVGKEPPIHPVAEIPIGDMLDTVLIGEGDMRDLDLLGIAHANAELNRP